MALTMAAAGLVTKLMSLLVMTPAIESGMAVFARQMHQPMLNNTELFVAVSL